MSIETLELSEKLNEFIPDDKLKDELDKNGNMGCDTSHKTNKNVLNIMKNGDQTIDEKIKNRTLDVETSILDEVPNKKRKKDFEPPKLQEDNRDIFCWRCHKYVGAGDVLPCYFCPRVFHLKCVQIQEKPSTFWLCTECDVISSAENPDKISPALSKLQKSDLAELLMFVMKRMRQHEGSSHFENPVDPDSYPDYKDYIVKPMYLSLLEHNVKKLKYASCESFLADTKWMVHNSYIFNTVHSELTLYAKAMMKNAKHECEEIINCPDCYLHANTLGEDKWFIEPCEKPHILVWARLKGFPYWPCKVMKSHATTVDVRFFGDHNKSLVPVDCCYLYSKQMPSKQKKVDELEVAIKEASNHIKRLEERFHVFQYAAPKILYNPKEEEEQRKLLLPYLDKPFYIKVKDKDKLFDPNIIGDIFEENSPTREADFKLKRKLESSSDFDSTCKKKNFNNQNEAISFMTSSNINSMPLPSLNKPTIIIEDTDADLLSPVGSFSTAREYNVGGYGRLNSLYPINQPNSFTENFKLNTLLEANENLVTGVSKPVNLSPSVFPKSNNFLKEKYQMKLPEENLSPSNFFKQIDLYPEKCPKININESILSPDDINVRQPNSQSSDTSNNKNNQVSDKLRISSNAKLISVLNENPALINNCIFKPMVVIQKLKDEVLCDYSNFSHQNKTDFRKMLLPNEKKTKNLTSKRQSLNYDLLNGNISDFFSVTEIDLEKDDSLSISIKDTEKTDKDSYSPLDSFIKSEPIDNDCSGNEEVDKSYIEKLSKSILDSTLDNRNEETDTEKQIVSISTSENEISSSPYSGSQLMENECLKNRTSPMFTSSILFSKTEDSEQFKRIVRNDNVDSFALNCENINSTLEQDKTSKKLRIETNINAINFISDSHENCVDGHNLHNTLVSCSGKEAENIDLTENEKEISSESGEIHPHPCEQENFLKRSFDLTVFDDGKLKTARGPIMQNEVVKDKKKLAESDCEIVNVVFSDKSSKIKPGFKTVKVPGRSLKMPLKTHVILSNSEKKQNDSKFINKTDASSNLCSKSTLGIKFVNFPNNGLKSNITNSHHPNKHEKNSDVPSSCLIDSNNEVDVSKGVQQEEKIMAMEIDNILSKVEKIDSKSSILQVLKEELKKFEENCKKKIQNYKRTYIEEMDSLYNMEKERWIQESMNVSENESKMMIDEIKKKQWCILCLNEAKFHCCWSTSYCSEKCQLADWPVHMKTCTQYSMRIDDPNLNLSPKLKERFKQIPKAVNGMKIKDAIDLITKRQISNNGENCLLPSDLISSTSFCQSYSVKKTFTPSINKVEEQEQDHLKDLSQDQRTASMDNSCKSFFVPVSPSNRNTAFVSSGNVKNSNKMSGRSYTNNSNHHSMKAEGNRFIMAKKVIPTKVIKKTVPILSSKNVSSVQDNRKDLIQPLFITMPNAPGDNGARFSPKHSNNNEVFTITGPSRIIKKSLEQTSFENGALMKSGQSFIIIGKNGKSPNRRTNKIGVQDVE